MSLSNLASWSYWTSAEKPTACGAAEKPTACGAAEKPTACGAAEDH